MSTALTAGQHALLESELRLARQRAERALQTQLDGTDRITHASALLDGDSGEWPPHEADRELDQVRVEHLRAELRSIDDALMRLKMPGYGRCVDCGAAIPFDRLQQMPQALRCLECQAATEAAR